MSDDFSWKHYEDALKHAVFIFSPFGNSYSDAYSELIQRYTQAPNNNLDLDEVSGVIDKYEHWVEVEKTYD